MTKHGHVPHNAPQPAVPDIKTVIEVRTHTFMFTLSLCRLYRTGNTSTYSEAHHFVSCPIKQGDRVQTQHREKQTQHRVGLACRTRSAMSIADDKHRFAALILIWDCREVDMLSQQCMPDNTEHT
jgi:hypothetical protein